MVRYRSSSRRNSYKGYKNYNAGSEAAKRHIEEAKAFSDEIGGTDKDVKAYFFGLVGEDLQDILKEYGHRYGEDKREYAQKTLYNWKTGKTKMSGLVAKRLFDLLPPRMPTKTKYELAENIWKHFGPSSNYEVSFGPQTNLDDILVFVSAKLDEQITKYNIPRHVQNRFNWLAGGDVKVQEELLNHFRQMEKKLALKKINYEFPVLQNQISQHSEITGLIKSVIVINKQEFTLWVDKKLDNRIQEGRPQTTPRYSNVVGDAQSDGISTIFKLALLVGSIILILKIFG